MRPRLAGAADRNMLFVGAAGVCGALVLIVLIFAGAKGRLKETKASPEISPELIGAQVPERDPNARVLIGRNQKATGDPLQSLQTGRGELEFTNDEGLLAFRYRWDKSDPLETGWNRFTNPRAWIYRSETQLIQLRADEGKFLLAENRQPQAGVLEGNVIVSLFESREKGGAYKIDPDRTVPVAQFETTSLNFDAVQLTGRTQERVIARTPDLIIIGSGMNLVFNERLGRIEELTIEQREHIAYRQSKGEGQSPSARSEPGPLPAESPAHGATPPTANAQGGSGSNRSAWDGVTPYRLILTDEVIITQGSGDELLTIEGRNLQAEFALGETGLGGELVGTAWRRPVAPRAGSEATLRRVAWTSPSNRWEHVAALPIAAAASPVTYLGSDQSPGDADLKITGSGGLTLVPIDETPVQLAHPDDLYATLDGEPVRVSFGSFYALGSDIEYSKSQQVARLNCTRDRPLEAGLPGEARLTSGFPFEYHLDENRGMLMGAGTIVGLAAPPADGQPPTRPSVNASAMKGLPEGFSVNWINDFTVEFSGVEQGQGLGKIAAATFNGAVHVDDPAGYSLDSDQLRIDFKDKPGAEQQLVESITATGEAMLRSAEGNVSGDELFVLFDENAEGASYPSQMTVTGRGRIVDAGGSIAAQYIQADLVEQSMASELALPARFGGSSTFAVSDLLAQGAVVLSFDDGVRVMADRLDADARTDTAVLTGESVIVSDPSLKVMGKHAQITNLSSPEKDRVARFIGPGTLTYLEVPREAPEGPGRVDPARPVTTPEDMREELRRRLRDEPAPASEEPDTRESSEPFDAELGTVNIDWADQLTFEEGLGRITFEGDVVATSEPTPREVDELRGNWMQIELTSPISAPGGSTSASVRRLRKMTMLGGREQTAQVKAERFTDDARTKRELLLAVSSEIIEYTEATELFEAIGEGWMLVVDARPESKTPSTGERAPEAAAVQFSGPGETDFSWGGRLSLQGGPGLLTLSEQVVMRHRPKEEPVVRLDCDTMTASLHSAESVSALDLSKSQGLELTRAVADGSVYLRREDRSIWADRLDYDRKTLLATIESFNDNYVVMESESTGGAVQARRILWDFFTNGITVEGARVDGPMPPIAPGR